jgi:hypothetical protein
MDEYIQIGFDDCLVELDMRDHHELADVSLLWKLASRYHCNLHINRFSVVITGGFNELTSLLQAKELTVETRYS